MLNLPVTIKNNVQVMTSIQLAEMLGYEKKEINKKIRAMFGDKKVREKFSPAIRDNGQVDYYNLPELESKMFVAKHNIEYLEMITKFWIEKGKAVQPKELTQDEQLLQLAQGVIRLTKERDEAIRTKAQINDKRTATLMNKASQDAKRIKKLESQLQDQGDYLSLIAAGIKQYVDTETKSHVQSWRVLKEISIAMEKDIKKVDDPRYGKVNTYHVDVIAAFKKLYC